jgi:hypothetical protein
MIQMDTDHKWPWYCQEQHNFPVDTGNKIPLHSPTVAIQKETKKEQS